ncbi:MarR family winged helix-turn-helix transcriptional regulator [Antarcticimicrobium sediminis]|nr:MarR family transcriptional regulator [Antarcticimicrobium sediminis]
MSTKNKLNTIFDSDLRHLMVVSYFVLGNNAVTNRYIERRYQFPVQAWSTLFSIVMFPGIRAKEITHLFPRPQNTISRAISLLATRGLIRHQTSTTDGREKRLFATPAGEELLDEIRAISVQRQDELFSPLTDAERETFFTLARKIANGPKLLESDAMPSDVATGKERNTA